MLRTNLATRPFYNVALVKMVLGGVAALVLALTLLNLVQLVRLAASHRALGARTSEATQEAARLRADAARIRAQINPEELQLVAAAAREANALIDQRAFSWTELFARFETTLPDDVRITAVQPQLDRDGRFTVSVGLEAREPEDLDAFVEALEAEGGFRNVLAVQEQTGADGLIQAIVRGTYTAPPRGDTPALAGGAGH